MQTNIIKPEKEVEKRNCTNVRNPGRFGPESFRPGHFGLGRFGRFLGWVVSALVGGSFRPIFGVSRFGPGSFRPKSIQTNKALTLFSSE